MEAEKGSEMKTYMYVLPEIAVDEVGIQIEENLVEGISEDGDYKKKKKR